MLSEKVPNLPRCVGVNLTSLCYNILQGLMTGEDLEVEVFPANPVIPAQSDSVTVKLMLKPKTPGTLTVLGLHGLFQPVFFSNLNIKT